MASTTVGILVLAILSIATSGVVADTTKNAQDEGSGLTRTMHQIYDVEKVKIESIATLITGIVLIVGLVAKLVMQAISAKVNFDLSLVPDLFGGSQQVEKFISQFQNTGGIEGFLKMGESPQSSSSSGIGSGSGSKSSFGGGSSSQGSSSGSGSSSGGSSGSGSGSSSGGSSGSGSGAGGVGSGGYFSGIRRSSFSN